MPELPEVETIVSGLRGALAGATIAGCELRFPGMVRHPEPELFVGSLTGRQIADVSRRGKYIFAALDRTEPGVDLLVIHLGMTGQLLITTPDAPIALHTHVVLRLTDGHELRYRDPRRFGRFLLGTEAELVAAGKLPRLGPEPLGAEFVPRSLRSSLKGRRAPLKALLLDQSVIAGVGNIYADEACFRARVRPDRSAGTLSPAAIGRLHRALRTSLELGIANRGSSVSDYLDAFGAKGSQQESLLVYGRAGQPCVRCSRPLASTRIAGRTTVFCKRCQR